MVQYKKGDYLQHISGQFYIKIAQKKGSTFLCEVFDLTERNFVYSLTFTERTLNHDFDKLPSSKYHIGDTFEEKEPEGHFDSTITITGKEWLLDDPEFPDPYFEQGWLYEVKASNSTIWEIDDETLDNAYTKVGGKL